MDGHFEFPDSNQWKWMLVVLKAGSCVYLYEMTVQFSQKSEMGWDCNWFLNFNCLDWSTFKKTTSLKTRRKTNYYDAISFCAAYHHNILFFRQRCFDPLFPETRMHLVLWLDVFMRIDAVKSRGLNPCNRKFNQIWEF